MNHLITREPHIVPHVRRLHKNISNVSWRIREHTVHKPTVCLGIHIFVPAIAGVTWVLGFYSCHSTFGECSLNMSLELHQQVSFLWDESTNIKNQK